MGEVMLVTSQDGPKPIVAFDLREGEISKKIENKRRLHMNRADDRRSAAPKKGSKNVQKTYHNNIVGLKPLHHIAAMQVIVRAARG